MAAALVKRSEAKEIETVEGALTENSNAGQHDMWARSVKNMLIRCNRQNSAICNNFTENRLVLCENYGASCNLLPNRIEPALAARTKGKPAG